MELLCNKILSSGNWLCKGQFIVSPKMLTKNVKDFCPGSLLEGRAEIFQIFGWHFERKVETKINIMILTYSRIFFDFRSLEEFWHFLEIFGILLTKSEVLKDIFTLVHCDYRAHVKVQLISEEILVSSIF